ncbi:MAG: MFS transporter [Polyangiaceae bacterium]
MDPSAEKQPAFAALRHRDFLLLWIGLGVSQAGTQVQRVAVAWQIYELTHSPIALGLIALFRAIPILGLGLFSGVVADAVDRRRLMLLTQSLMALSSTGLAVLMLTHHATPAGIYALTVLWGAGIAFDSPARQSIIPALVPRDALANAYSLNATTNKLASVIGPAIGGLILAGGGLAAAYVVDAVSFLAVIGAVLAMHHRHVPAPESRISAGAALEGLRFMRSQPLLVWLMSLDFIGTFFAGATQLMPIFADSVLHVGTRGLGMLVGAPAAGAVVAGLALSIMPEIRRRGVVVLGCVVLYGLTTAVFGLSTSFVLSLLMLAVAGGADAVSTVLRQTARNVVTPDALRGRMTSVNMLFFVGGPQLGEVEAGVVARFVGAPWSVALGGIACALAAAAIWAGVPVVRRHEA